MFLAIVSAAMTVIAILTAFAGAPVPEVGVWMILAAIYAVGAQIISAIRSNTKGD